MQALILVNTAGEVTVPSILRYNELREEQSVNSFSKILIIEHVGLLQAICEKTAYLLLTIEHVGLLFSGCS